MIYPQWFFFEKKNFLTGLFIYSVTINSIQFNSRTSSRVVLLYSLHLHCYPSTAAVEFHNKWQTPSHKWRKGDTKWMRNGRKNLAQYLWWRQHPGRCEMSNNQLYTSQTLSSRTICSSQELFRWSSSVVSNIYEGVHTSPPLRESCSLVAENTTSGWWVAWYVPHVSSALMFVDLLYFWTSESCAERILVRRGASTVVLASTSESQPNFGRCHQQIERFCYILCQRR